MFVFVFEDEDNEAWSLQLSVFVCRLQRRGSDSQTHFSWSSVSGLNRRGNLCWMKPNQMANQITGKTESSLRRGLDTDKKFTSLNRLMILLIMSKMEETFLHKQTAATNNHFNHWFTLRWIYFLHRLNVCL